MKQNEWNMRSNKFKLVTREVNRKKGRYLYQLVEIETSLVRTKRVSDKGYIAVSTNGNSYKYFENKEAIDLELAKYPDTKFAYIDNI